jgi:antitoxin component YwqK of YwqJK toxin-antitoxin module
MTIRILQLSFILLASSAFCQSSLPQIVYYPNGQKEFENYSVNGPDSLCRNKEWFENGAIRFEQKRIGCNCESTRYYQTGRIESIDVEKMIYDEVSHEWIGFELVKSSKYCENGQQTESMDYSIRGRKEFLLLNCIGDTLILGQIIDDFMSKTGHWIYYWGEGIKKTEGDYKSTYSAENANIKIGKWTYWTVQGNLIREEWYDDFGVMVKEQNY